MSLPKLNAPIYELTLPSDGKKKIKYRPFLVKEEKILLTALETEDENNIANALIQILSNCILTDINVDNLASFDVEYIFLQLRSKSVGEVAEVRKQNYDCGKENQDSCIIDVDIKLDDIEIQKSKKHTKKIMLNDDIGVQMRYPTIKTINKIQGTDTTTVDSILNTIGFCIESVYTKDEVFPMDQASYEEKKDFLESLSRNQLEKISNFFTTMPQLKKTINMECQECGKKLNFELSGIRDFFS